MDELTAERDRLDRMIADLVRSRDVLDGIISTASEGLGAAALSGTGGG